MANSKFVIGKDCPIVDVILLLKSSPSFHMFHDNVGDFVRELGTPAAKAKKWKYDYLHNMIILSDLVNNLVEEWATRNGSSATLQELTRVLNQIELKNCAELLENKLTLKEAEAKPTFKKYRHLPTGLQCFLKGPTKFCILHTLDNDISCAKIRDKWPNCAYHSWKNFIGLISATEKRDKNVVDIVRNCAVENLGQLGRVDYETSSENKVVFLTCVKEKEIHEVVEKLANWKNKVAVYSDKMPWEDLTWATQLEITDELEETFKINFQDVELNGEVLVDLINGKGVKLFRDTILMELNYYVGRRVLTRYFISMGIFEHPGPDIFLISGMDRYDLTNRAGNSLTDSTTNQIMQAKLSVRYMIQEQPSHFDKISAKTNSPVHLLRYENERLRWIKSRGGMSAIQKYVDKSQDEQAEEMFCRIVSEDGKEAVCISDSPGMGKSILLARLGNLLKLSYPERTIFFVVITQLIKQVKELGGITPDSKTVENALKLIVCENVIGNIVLTSKVSQQTDNEIIIELLLDGFDEVDSTDMKLAYELLSIIKTSFKSIRMWITSRPHFLHELENHLGILGYNIQPFNEEDQTQFLTSFWSRRGSPDTERLCSFANCCLNSFKKKMSSAERDIAGIPLQCLLIGEVYEEEALEYSEMCSESSSPLLIDVGTITTLYQSVIEKKLEKYKTVYEVMDFDENAIMEMHASLSLELIFPEEYGKIKHLLRPTQLDKVINVGIVESLGTATLDNARFIHRTFAEYFICWLVTDSLKNRKEYGWEVCDLFMSSILRTSTYTLGNHMLLYPVINYFINDIIMDCQENVPTDISDHIIDVSTELPGTIAKIANTCLIGNYVSIMQFFDGLTTFDHHACQSFNEGCLLLASQYSCLDLVRIVLRHFQEHHQFVQHLKVKVLRTVVKRGEYSLLEFFVKEQGFRELVEDLNVGTGMLLHDCIRDTKRNEKPNIDQRIKVVQMLVGINRNLLEAKDLEGLTPILQRDPHVELLIELIRLKANILVQGTYGDTILHNGRYYSAEDQLSLMTAIPEECLITLVQIKNTDSHTPLHAFIFWFIALPETIRMFKKVGADFNNVDSGGSSILETAIVKLRSVDTLRTLISCGSDVNWKRKDKDSTLLHLAACYGNLDAAKFLLDEHGFNVNVKNGEGYTPLTCLLNSDAFYGKRFETGLYLHERGGQFKEYRVELGKTLLHNAASRGNVCSIRLLLHISKGVNDVDEDGNTPLHSAVTSLSRHVISVLLDSGIDANISNKRGETALDIALRNREMDISTLRLLISRTDVKWTPSLAHLWLLVILNAGMEAEEGFNSVSSECSPFGVTLDWNYKDDNGNSLLHIAAYRNYMRACRCLIERKGVDIKSKNIRKQTVLHLAAHGQHHRVNIFYTIEYLVDSGADVFAMDAQNLTFLHIFSSRRMVTGMTFIESMFSYIVKKKYKSLFEIKGGANENTALHLAMDHYNRCQTTQWMTILYNGGVNFNTRDKYGHNVLWYAIRRHYSPEYISNLINFGADWKALDNNGSSLLHQAALYGNWDVLKIFLAFKVLNVRGANKDGNTPLHLAFLNVRSRVNVMDLCSTLIDSGADVNAKNKEGFKPLALALGRRYVDDELLRMLGAYDLSGSRDQGIPEDMSRVPKSLGNGQRVIKCNNYLSEIVDFEPNSIHPTIWTWDEDRWY